ncbi:MAG: protein tyrosine phosphatase family protein [Melioribacteraceae bacterium]|nr:protein tyrosine phosphatase family protein [Melioribacteraceae bacterium]
MNYRKNSENFSTSGQPTESELYLIQKAGFEIIINVRPESEMFYEFDEKRVVENLEMQYFQIPMTFDTLNKNILIDFFNQMEMQKDKKLLVHCHHNIRVSVLLAFYRILKLGWKKEDAYKDLEKMMEINSLLEDYFNYHIKIHS